MHHYDPISEIQDYLVFGEYGDVNPSITDSSTYTFLNPQTMKDLFDQEIEGCFLYSRHWNPTNKYLADALAKLEDSEAAIVTASGMGAISCAILQLCSAGDEIVSSRTIYGGTYAFFKNFLPRFGITVKFVNTQDLNAVNSAITKNTKVIYCESVSNPLLEIADIPKLSEIANQHNIKLMVDNTFSPIIISPIRLGAHVVVHSLTKFINGTSDCVAGCVCSSNEFIAQLTDINSGASMLLGPVLDSYRAASIMKNIHSLHIRIKKHSENAQYLAENLEKMGCKVFYPGLKSHYGYKLLNEIMNSGVGFGGMLAIDAGTTEKADEFMAKMQNEKVGYLAVSLGYFKTLFSSPGHSTSSEIPEEERKAMGLSEGLVRISIGLDNDIKKTYERIKKCLIETGLCK
ncbi:MAG: aminotransferase class I/II-fold pyridoxal phosphate-dependent enzyme [Ignavibacteriaceae bacterium]|nr:aminotransferase class I/II-fold pyridoxal phosphate-dependent enzyme [Ignavibacterium sp.]MCC6253885.1 aminotransferase class I/II-fold pyridoxal phosphate-dependent enzyme [Ignavibacteriaceae bacterium]HMN23085.1 aminotransferase class I/II-fold pyridoxal phosphate-dependent enzyme [Ignavibacteriaceae bacterium]HRN27171.1 aminotransferase class I/II-fold pyridoxal phosphate-dependent enzyme [Ignavibacteriaceae bacterium]HRP93237.1 aminotransferase class I/II-fold pyridoxal phosphate-depend